MKQVWLVIYAALLLWICWFAAAISIQAQQSSRPITVNTDLVVTWTQVTNPNDGSPVKGLSIDDFQLWEEGKQQPISLVKVGQPLSVVILVDGMTCVRPPEIEFQRSREALRQLGENAEIALMAWDSDVRLVQPFTKGQQVVADQLEDRVSFFVALNGPKDGRSDPVRPGRDHSRPGEAIYQAARYLEKAASPERRKIIIVITQSQLMMARTHPHNAAEVEALLKKTGTTVYALLENNGIRSLDGSDEYNPVTWLPVRIKKQQRRSGGTPEQFVDLTGGSILISKKMPWANLNTLTPDSEFGKEFDDLFIKLTSLIRSSYTIGYYPQNSDFDGRFRRISLELSRSGKAKAGKVEIKARSGYQALRPSPVATLELNPNRK